LPEEARDIVLWYGAKYNFDTLNRLGVNNECGWQANWQTDFHSKCRS